MHIHTALLQHCTKVTDWIKLYPSGRSSEETCTEEVEGGREVEDDAALKHTKNQRFRAAY